MKMCRRTVRRVVFLLVLALVGAFVPAADAQTGAGFVVLKDFGAPVTAIGALSGSSSVIVVATQNAGVYSMSGTSTMFRKIPAQLDLMRITSIAVLSPDRWLVGTDGDGLWLVQDGGTSIEQVRTLDCSRVARIVRDPRDADKLFLASLCTGLHTSTDRGATWKSGYPGITSFVLTDVVRMDGDRIAVSSQDSGVFVSTNNGVSYVKTSCPIKNVSSLAWDAVGKTLYAAGGTSVTMTRDAGLHWTSLPTLGAVAGVTATPTGTILVGIPAKGLLRWDSTARAWRETAQGAGITSVNAMALEGTTLITGGLDGEVASGDLGGAVAAIAPAMVDLGAIPSNQRGTASLAIMNIGRGALTWRVENVPGYMTVTPQLGAAVPATVTFTVEGDGLGKGPYQGIIKVVTSGGEQVIPFKFSIVDTAAIRIGLAVGKTAATVGTKTVTLDAPPYIDKSSGRTMVPMRFIGEAFGAVVTWDASTRRVFVETQATAAHKPVLMIMTIGKRQATVNGKAVTLDVSPAIVAGRTFVPLRVISETLGADVAWNATARTVSISYMP